MKNVFLFFLCLSCSIPLGAQSAPKGDLNEVQTVDGIITALYDVISGPAGQTRNWDRMRSLFKSDARLIAVGRTPEGQAIYRPMTVSDYIERSGPNLEKNGFFEQEIGRKTDVFGYVTHVFSTYQSQREAGGEVFSRGINSIQLVFEEGRYWIVTVLWNSETKENPIPKKYLKKRD